MVLSFALVVGAAVDQLTTGALEAYSVSMYSAHGVAAEPGAIYGLVYMAGGVLVVLWLLVGLGARAGRRWGPGAMVAAVVVNAVLALTMLFVTEYAEPVFPPMWGLLAALPAAAGIGAAAVLIRRRAGRSTAA